MSIVSLSITFRPCQHNVNWRAEREEGKLLPPLFRHFRLTPLKPDCAAPHQLGLGASTYRSTSTQPTPPGAPWSRITRMPPRRRVMRVYAGLPVSRRYLAWVWQAQFSQSQTCSTCAVPLQVHGFPSGQQWVQSPRFMWSVPSTHTTPGTRQASAANPPTEQIPPSPTGRA